MSRANKCYVAPSVFVDTEGCISFFSSFLLSVTFEVLGMLQKETIHLLWWIHFKTGTLFDESVFVCSTVKAYWTIKRQHSICLASVVPFFNAVRQVKARPSSDEKSHNASLYARLILIADITKMRLPIINTGWKPAHEGLNILLNDVQLNTALLLITIQRVLPRRTASFWWQ